MAAAPRKLSLLGPGGAGKTSLALRIAGDDQACAATASSGTRVLDAKLPCEGARGLRVRLWDGPGRTLLDSLGQPLLARADALLLVADGSDAGSVAALPLLYASARKAIGERPALVLLNKRDLKSPGIAASVMDELGRLGPVHRVSALTGDGLDAALSELVQRLG